MKSFDAPFVTSCDANTLPLLITETSLNLNLDFKIRVKSISTIMKVSVTQESNYLQVLNFRETLNTKGT